jgi:hypothetical protein
MKKILFLILSTLFLVACDDDSFGNHNDTSRHIRYQVDGNFTGTMSAHHTTHSGGTGTVEFSDVPWSMLILFEKKVPSAAMAIAGSGGIEGQTLTVEVYQDDILQSTNHGTAGSNGSIVIGTPPIVF